MRSYHAEFFEVLFLQKMMDYFIYKFIFIYVTRVLTFLVKLLQITSTVLLSAIDFRLKFLI